MIRTDTPAPPVALHVTDEDPAHADTVHRFALHGSLRVGTRDRFKAAALEELANVVARHTRGALKIRLDFAHLTDVDAAGLGAIITVVRRMRAAGAVVHACGLQEDLVALFRAMKLDEELSLELATAVSRG